MKKTIILAAFSLLTCCFAIGQSDTSFYYFSLIHRPTTEDSAEYVLKLVPKNGEWFGTEYLKKNGKVRSEGLYSSNDPKSANGTFKNYDEDGNFTFEANWIDGKLQSRYWVHKNGTKKSLITYKDGRIEKQAGWDENGKEIKNYIVEREARFKGGPEGWRKYLEKHLNAMVAANAGAPAGEYPVMVQFVVNKEGNVSKVRASSVPVGCKPCGNEAVSVILTGPSWEPAIQNNEPVIYQAIQYITFVVVDDSKAKKG